MRRTRRRGAKRQAKRGRTYQCRFGPSPRRRSTQIGLDLCGGTAARAHGSVRTSAAAHESDHLDHSACSKRQMAAATGPVSSASWPLAQANVTTAQLNSSVCTGSSSVDIPCSLEYCGLEQPYLVLFYFRTRG